MGRTTKHIRVRDTHHSVYLGEFVMAMLGDPKTIGVSGDQNNLALRLSPNPSGPMLAYEVRSSGRRYRKPYLDIRVNRKGMDMPPGAYNWVNTKAVGKDMVFIHESRPATNPHRPRWSPYSKLARNRNFVSLRVMPNSFRITGRVWESLGKPGRVTLTHDPVQGLLTVRPDPEGPHSLNSYDTRGRHVSAQQATVSGLEDSIPTGIYQPVSLGRFEGVFELAFKIAPKVVKRDTRPNPKTYKHGPIIPDKAYKGWPSRAALAQRARRLRELSEKMEEERK